METTNYFTELKANENGFFIDMINYLDVKRENIFDANDLNDYLEYCDEANDELWFTTFDYLPVVTTKGIENGEVDLNNNIKNIINQQEQKYGIMLTYDISVTDTDYPKPLTNGDVLKYIKNRTK